MSGDQLNLDEILARAKRCPGGTDVEYTVAVHDVPALVAEVRRLRAIEASLAEEVDEAPHTYVTSKPNPILPGRNLLDTQMVTWVRRVTPWEPVA